MVKQCRGYVTFTESEVGLARSHTLLFPACDGPHVVRLEQVPFGTAACMQVGAPNGGWGRDLLCRIREELG